MKKKITFVLLAVFLILGTVFAISAFAKDDVTPQEMASRIENAIHEVLGDEYKKQTETVVAGTLKYADKEGNAINYHILKTTYYEADPNAVQGLNVDALGVLFDPDRAISCKEMKIPAGFITKLFLIDQMGLADLGEVVTALLPAALAGCVVDPG